MQDQLKPNIATSKTPHKPIKFVQKRISSYLTDGDYGDYWMPTNPSRKRKCDK